MMTEQPLIRIVVAEDEELIRNNLVKKIHAIDPSLQVIYAAEDGRNALEFIKENPVHLVITDIRMPVMDGLELIEALYLHHPHVRKIVSTGYADFEYARQAMRYGAADYILKPVKPEELRRALSKAMTSIEKEHHPEKRNLAGAKNRADKPEEIVLLVQDYLRENYMQEFNLEEIARNFNFTSSYLSKIFLKHTGEPPSKYVIALRIQAAKHLLGSQRELSIKEVAERVGYPDQFYFSRIFKQLTGCTPKEFQSGIATVSEC